MSLYEDLGVAPDADKATIQRAYRRAAQRAHPDKPGGSDEAFQRIALAYGVLSDEAKRERYDRTGESSDAAMEQQAEATIAGMFQNMVDAADIDHDDIVEAMTVQIRQKIAGFRDDIDKAKAAIKKYQRVLRRIKHTGAGKNILAGTVRARIHNLEIGINLNAENIVFAEVVAAMLKDYGYEVDQEKPMRPTPFVSMFTTTGAGPI